MPGLFRCRVHDERRVPRSYQQRLVTRDLAQALNQGQCSDIVHPVKTLRFVLSRNAFSD